MKDKAWRRWKANQTPESRLGNNRARNKYTSTSRKACTAHKARIKDKMTNELHSGSKSWWWTANWLMDKGGKPEIPVLKSGGQTFITAEEKAECFASFFSDKSTIPEAENSKAIPHIPQRPPPNAIKSSFGQSKWESSFRSLMSTKPLDQMVSPLLYSEMLQLNSLLPLLDFSSCASTKNICRHSGRWRIWFHASRRVTNIL